MQRQRRPHDSTTLPRYASSMDDDRLFQHTKTLDQGANFLATRDGHLALVTPHDAIAEDWLRGHVGEEATWLGQAYPFALATTDRRLKISAVAASDDPIVEQGKKIYLACLYMSVIRSGLLDAKAANVKTDPAIGNLFR